MCTQVLHFVVSNIKAKGEVVVNLEKEKEAKASDRTLVSVWPDAGP
jgi:hypothetical protein